jgi:hypothetical protein
MPHLLNSKSVTQGECIVEAPSQSAAAEAKQLNVTLEQDNGEWIAVLPPHPDLKSDEAVGFPAPSEQEALDEARAYRSIEQSSVFKFEYDEKQDQYIVTFGQERQAGKYLAPTYSAAQRAYAAMINEPEPPVAAPAPEPKQQRKRRSGNGTKPAIEADPQFTSGIGDDPGQLTPPVGANAWVELAAKVDKLETNLIRLAEATAKALEDMKR